MEETALKNMDIVVFGLQPWDIAIGSNCKNMASIMAIHNRVLYINRPLDRASYYRNSGSIQIKARLKALKDKNNTPQEVQPGLWVFNPAVLLESINFLPVGYLYKYFNKKNVKLLAKEIQKAMELLNFKNNLLFVDNDFFNAQYLKEFLKPDLFIYYIRDYLRSQNYFKKHGQFAEPSLIKKADAVATNSAYLAEYAANFNNKVLDVGQGCEVDAYLNKPDILPFDLADISKPVIGYCGSLTATRLDVNLIFLLAKSNSKWQFVLVGPEDEVFKNSALHELKNVHFLGSKNPGELPHYVHGFDVCINPQLLNEMTIGNYPRKVDEYLAAGKPVVATRTKAMEMFAEYCYLGNGVSDYENNILKALEENPKTTLKKLRIEFAKAHTWEASVNKLYKLINNISNGRAYR